MITVALPAFKARYLREALASLLAQTWTDFELVVVDDASPEPLREIVESFSDPRITYHRNPVNLGGKNLIANWNRCLELATRPWVVLASDDDLYAPDYLARMMELSGRYPQVDIFHSRVAIIDGEGRIIDYTSGCPEWETAEDFLWHRMKRLRGSYIPEFIFRTQVLREMGGFVDFPAAWGSDVATCVKAGERHGIGCANDPLVQWRRSGLNISTSDRFLSQKGEGLDRFMDWIQAFLEGRGTPIARAALERIDHFYEGTASALYQRKPFHELARDILFPRPGRFTRRVAVRSLLVKTKNLLGKS